MFFIRTAFTFLFVSLSSVIYSQPSNPETWVNQGDEFHESLKYKEAIKAYQKSLDKKENEEALWGLAHSKFELGNQYQFNGNAESQKHYREALDISERLVKLNSINADYLLFRGMLYLYNNLSEKSISDFEKARNLAPNNGRVYYYLWTQLQVEAAIKINHEYVQKAFDLDTELFELHQELGAYYSGLNMGDEAIFHYEKAISISPNNYKSNFALGQVYWALGNLEKMRHHFGESLVHFPNFGYAKMLLGGVELMSNNLQAAVPLIRAALKDNPDTEQYLTMYIQNYPELANYNFKSSDKVAPLDAKGYPTYYSEALALAQTFDFYGAISKWHECHDLYSQYEVAQPAWQASILSWMTHCYREIGNYGEAANLGKRALDLAMRENLTTDQASLAANLAMIYSTWGDFPKAIYYAKTSLNYLLTYNQNEQLYDAYINLGGYYRKWDLNDSAVYYHRKAMAKVSSSDSVKFVLTQKELAISYASNLQMDSARLTIETMNQARSSLKFEGQAAALDLGSAQVYYTLGEYQKAWDYITKASEHFLQLEEVAADHPMLIPFLENYIGISSALNMKGLAAANYQALNYKLINQIRSYFPAMSENGKLLFYREITQHFESFNSFAANNTDLNQQILHQLYENQLLVKGLLFNDAAKIQNSIAHSKDQTLKTVYTKLLERKNLLARSVSLTPEEKTSRKIDSEKIQHQIDSLQIKLLSLGLEPSTNTIYEPEIVQKVKDQLEPGQAAIEILRFKTYDFSKGGSFSEKVNYLALILKSNSNEIEYVHLSSGNLMESKGYQAYTNAISFEFEDLQSYETFWSPIALKLKGINRVYFAGDGVYHKININTLLNTSTNQYVLDEMDVRLVTSTRDLIKETLQLPERGEVYLVGFPTYSLSEKSNDRATLSNSNPTIATRAFTQIENLAPLPGTYSEVKTIETLLEKSKWKTNVLTGAQALEERIKMLDNPTILHIATHGYFEESTPKDNPLFYSGLFLSGASSNYQNKLETAEDGILTAYEAMHLNLNQTQMVVLSACETGMGRVENGEGVYGLQRAFLIAGSKSVVMSLWKVNDQTTMQLMSEFYANLKSSKDKHVAFRSAQIELKKKHPNAKYWGAFNIVGN